jgi:hypothetical protein
MSYELKPIYHFDNLTSTGINKVPLNRLIIVEAAPGTAQWYIKIEAGGITDTSTISDAIAEGILRAPLDEKRDVLDSYTKAEIDGEFSLKMNIGETLSVTEIEALITLKRDISDSYSRDEVDTTLLNKRDISDSYNISEVNMLLGSKYDVSDAVVILNTKLNINDAYDSIEIDDLLTYKQDTFVLAPTSSIGVDGDTIGQIAISSDYIFYCTATYTDGLSDIWARTPLTLETW